MQNLPAAEKYDIIAIIHRIFTEGKRKRGGLDKILSYLNQKGKKILMIEHPLRGLSEGGDQTWHKVILSTIENGEIVEKKKLKTKNLPNVLQWINEIKNNLFLICKYASPGAIFLSSDPLNSIPGIILKKKFRHTYFHCVDFSPQRFNNVFLNAIYQLILKFTLFSFDTVGTVSHRVYKELVKAGCKKKKLFYLPNSPFFKETNITKKEPLTLICTGGAIIDKYDYELIIEVMHKLKKEFPAVKLYAVGGKTQAPEYIKILKEKITQYKLQKNIIFTGFMEPEEIEKLLEKAAVGLSFYSQSARYYTYFGDSLKIREYALFGLPTVADGNSATDAEMEKAGAGVIIKNIDQATRAIGVFLTNEKRYKKFQKNGIKWAKKMDKKRMLESLYKKLFN